MIDGIEKYELSDWIDVFESVPVKLVKSIDVPSDYDMIRAKVFELKSGKYALVSELGCSCYSSVDAVIDLFPNEQAALEALDRWQTEYDR